MVVRKGLKGKKEEEPDLSRGWFLLVGHMMGPNKPHASQQSTAW